MIKKLQGRFTSLVIFTAATIVIALFSNLIVGIAAVLPFIGFYSVYKHYHWWKALRPSRFLAFLLTSAIAVTIASIGLSSVTLYRQLIIGPDAPSPAWSPFVVTISIMIVALQAYVRTLTMYDLDQSIKDENDEDSRRHLA